MGEAPRAVRFLLLLLILAQSAMAQDVVSSAVHRFRVEKVADHPVFDKKDFIFTELLGVRYVPLFHP